MTSACEARGHRPLPDVKTIEALQSKAHMERLATPLDELAQGSLQHVFARRIGERRGASGS